MKFKTKINNYDCKSLEEMIEKRDTIKDLLKQGDYAKRLEDVLNNRNFLKHIIVEELSVSPLCDYLFFKVMGTCNVEENKKLEKAINGQLSDGMFENFPYDIGWEVERFWY